MRFDALLQQGVSALEGYSKSPRLDAELLLAHALGIGRTELHARMQQEAASDDIARFRVYLEQRKAHEPIAYILGVKEFWSLEFAVSHSVLVPRPETELLVEKGLAVLKGREGEPHILDLGTGSGCLAIALAVELKKAERNFSVLAVDTSADALDVAVDNALRHGVLGDILFLESVWFSEIDPEQEQFDLIVSNPPYIPEHGAAIDPELAHEPREALFSGRKGTEAIRQLMFEVSAFLSGSGVFLCEIGAGQAPELLEYFEQIKDKVEPRLSSISFHKDLAGHDRVMEIRRCG